MSSSITGAASAPRGPSSDTSKRLCRPETATFHGANAYGPTPKIANGGRPA